MLSRLLRIALVSAPLTTLIAAGPAGAQPAGDAEGGTPAWAARASLVGHWSGAYQRLHSVMPVHVTIERGGESGLRAFAEYPDWVYYGKRGPVDVTVEEDRVVPVEINTERLRSLLDEAGNKRSRIVTVPGARHSIEHGDLVRQIEGRVPRTAYYKFDRTEVRYFECTVEFLREIGIATR